MPLDERYELQIKIAHQSDGGPYDGLFDSLNSFLTAHPDGEGEFVFVIIDKQTGETAKNTADAYTNVNDAYSAYAKITGKW